ncbi:MAG: 2-dehydropantoate 2-reductase N-terminal domain-containing protein [Nocardioides sp.]|uniref:ketopantoate reductase family protein n=1 Tax=Nocardioides sp. TaxID=35761 RepID=UPI0039E65FF4
MSHQKIAVLGTGANGAAVGADLSRAGLDVTLIDQWPANVERMRTEGVRQETPDGADVTTVRALHLCDVATLRDRFDVVFVVVNAYDTRWACELIKPYLAPDALVVGLQNGMTVDVMAEVVGPERTLGSVIEIAAAMFEPGVVDRHTPVSGTWFALGGIDPATVGRAQEVAGLLGNAGTVAVVDDIRSAKWMKLVVNSAELVTSACLDLPLLQAAQVPGMHDFMIRAGKEAVRTSVDLGHRIVPIFGLEEVDPDQPELFVERMLDAVYTHWSLPHTLTTVLQDWRKGRHSEVDELNGYVVQQRAILGGSAPANARTVEVAHRIENGELRPGVENAELLLAPL